MKLHSEWVWLWHGALGLQYLCADMGWAKKQRCFFVYFFLFVFLKKDPLRLHLKVLVLDRFLAGLIKVHFRDLRYRSPWLIEFDITGLSWADRFAWPFSVRNQFVFALWFFEDSEFASFSSPEPLGLICNRSVALDATENTNFFIGWRQWMRKANWKYNLLRITFYFVLSRPANIKSVSEFRRLR